MNIKTRKHPLLRGIGMALALSSAAGLASQVHAKDVTWDDIANDAQTPENVLGYGIGPKAQRYSPMTTINRDNVERLVPAWSFSFGDEKQRGQESQAVVHDGHALLTQAGHPSRQGESPPVRAALAELGLVIHDMADPGRLDGGDVLRVGRTLYVGRSQRSNAAGLVQLLDVFGPLGFGVVPVDVTGLHLKSVCSSPVDGLVLLAADTIHPATFDGVEVIVLPPSESHAANAVGIGDTVLIAGNSPVITAELKARGLTVVEVGTSEVRKADGALTCCSIIFD